MARHPTRGRDETETPTPETENPDAGAAGATQPPGEPNLTDAQVADPDLARGPTMPTASPRFTSDGGPREPMPPGTVVPPLASPGVPVESLPVSENETPVDRGIREAKEARVAAGAALAGKTADMTRLHQGGATTEELQTLPNTPIENSGIPSNLAPATPGKTVQVGQQVDLATANREAARTTRELNEPDRPVTHDEMRQYRRRGKPLV